LRERRLALGKSWLARWRLAGRLSRCPGGIAVNHNRSTLLRPLLLLVSLVLLLAPVGCNRRSSQADDRSAASLPGAASGSAVASDPAARGEPRERAAAAGSSAPNQERRGLFYKVESPSATAYLLGSIHVGKRQSYPLPAAIESAFERADTLVLEVALDEQQKLEAGAKLAAVGTYPAGDSLDRHISAELMQAVTAKLRDAAVPPAAISRFRPWFAATLLTVSELGKLGYEPEQGIDVYFQRRATKEQKRVVGLETLEEQVALFTGLSPKVEELMLRESLDELPRLAQVMQGAIRAWDKGDAQGLDQMLMHTMKKPEYRQLYQRIFVERNLKMAGEIEQYLATSSVYFVVVGSGHVVGKQGIVEVLRARRRQVVQQ
jgi:uncharacterized protein YbaP (TraB family)